MNSKTPITVTYYSDILCIWAYCAQARVDELRARFPQDVVIDVRFISVFGNVANKIGEGWKDRGGFAGYDAHVRMVAEKFLHVETHPELWVKTRPASSASPHMFLKAVQLNEGSHTVDTVAWAMRKAFFRDARDIADKSVQWDIIDALKLNAAGIKTSLRQGLAMAALMEDYDLQKENNIKVSPTFLLNEGRQKLLGNVGYRVIEANIQELLKTGDESLASWC